jgi:hypothetical protein
MTEKRIVWLGGLLVVQLLVVAALLMGRADFRQEEQGPLFEFERADIDRVIITEPTMTLELVRRAARWQLADETPADAAKIEDLLGKLAALRAPWPVATTAGAQARFEVADGNHQRRIRLESAGEAVVDLYLGTAPGFRRLHARLPGRDEIYEVDLNHFQLPVDPDEWLDRGLLQAQGEIAAIAREGIWRLARSDEGWLLEDGAADSAAAEQMAARLANLRVLGLADADQLAHADDIAAVFVVTDAAGPHRISIRGTAESTEYVVVSDRVPGGYRLAAFIAEQLLTDAPMRRDPAAAAEDPGLAEDPQALAAPPETLALPAD